MGYRKIKNHVAALFVACILASFQGFTKEFHAKTECSNSDLSLDCGGSSFIAIHKAIFSNNITGDNSSCLDLEIPDICSEDIRNSVNRRCSGLNSCIYRHSKYSLYRKCRGEGEVRIQFDCVKESSVNRFCNTLLRAPKGYISSPGYPKFYPKLHNCKWTILGGEGQSVLVKILDVHMQMPRLQFSNSSCHDSLTIMEGSNKLLSTCNSSLENVESTENHLVVQFESESFTPASGFLIFYKFEDCPTPLSPHYGYLAYRNGSSALYTCLTGYVFNDTLESSRTLQCMGSKEWNISLAPCISLQDLKENINFSNVDVMLVNMTNDDTAVTIVLEAKDTFLEDILIPSVLMVILIVGNTIVVGIIICITRKQKPDEDEANLNPVSSSNLVGTAQGTEV